MFKNMNHEEHFPGAKGPAASLTGHGVAALRHEAQENSWIGLLSVVSRPAMSLLQRVFPGRARTPALADVVPEWAGGDSAFLGHLDDILPGTPHPPHHMAYLHCRRDSWLTAESLAELGIQNTETMNSNQQRTTSLGYLASARSFLSQVVLNSPLAQDPDPSGSKTWPTALHSPANGNGNWWGFKPVEDSSHSWFSPSKEPPGPCGLQHSGSHCAQWLESGTKRAAVAKPTALYARCRDVHSVHGESTGASCHQKTTEAQIDNDSLETGQPESLSSTSGALPLEHHQPSDQDALTGLVVCAGSANSCLSSEVAVLTPDQDNGYSSLEEEHSTCRLIVLKGDPPEMGEDGTPTVDASCEETQPQGESGEQEDEEEEKAAAGETDREEEEEEEETETEYFSDVENEEETLSGDDQAGPSATAPLPTPTTPVCQNKAIAYIMGTPCSDDDSQSDDSLSDGDDGFDSEGSSDLSDSSDLDDDDDDGEDSDEEENEEDEEAERLWNSLCRSTDPYNPRNFTAATATVSRPVPTPYAFSNPPSPQSSPQSSPPCDHQPSSPPSSSSLDDSWDEASDNEVDGAESLRLWNSFSASSDPYSPMSFQGPLRTRPSPPAAPCPPPRTRPSPPSAPCSPGPNAGARGRGKKGRSSHHHRHHAAPPRSPLQEEGKGAAPAEERMDSGFSDRLVVTVETTVTMTIAAIAATTVTSCVTVKKVCFSEQVEEFYTSGEEEEDRRGPWEELARDRFRFQRRVQEVEESIGYVLAPAHRALAYRRLSLAPQPHPLQHHSSSS